MTIHTRALGTPALASGALRLAGGALKLAVVVMSLFMIALIADGLMRSLEPGMHWAATALTALFITLWMLFGAAVAWQLSLVLTLIGGLIGGGLGALLGFLVAGIAGFVLSAQKITRRALDQIPFDLLKSKRVNQVYTLNPDHFSPENRVTLFGKWSSRRLPKMRRDSR